MDLITGTFFVANELPALFYIHAQPIYEIIILLTRLAHQNNYTADIKLTHLQLRDLRPLDAKNALPPIS